MLLPHPRLHGSQPSQEKLLPVSEVHTDPGGLSCWAHCLLLACLHPCSLTFQENSLNRDVNFAAELKGPRQPWGKVPKCSWAGENKRYILPFHPELSMRQSSQSQSFPPAPDNSWHEGRKRDIRSISCWIYCWWAVAEKLRCTITGTESWSQL